jgi:putative membrane protein insertion efficiency factor
MEGRPSPCRFTPSCSQYALDALAQHGTSRGLWLTLRRLLRCRPFGPSGWDPVPPATHPAPSDTAFTFVHRRHRHLHWRDSGFPA